MAIEGVTNFSEVETKNGYQINGVQAVDVATLTLTPSEVKSLNSTPQTLISAPGSGKVIIVDKVIGTINFNSTAYATNTTLEFKTKSGNTKVVNDSTSLLGATADKAVEVGKASEVAVDINEEIDVQVATGDPTSGDSDVKFKALYRVISI